ALDCLRLVEALCQFVGRLLLHAVERGEQLSGAIGPAGFAWSETDDAACAAQQWGIRVAMAMLVEQAGQADEQRARVNRRRCTEIQIEQRRFSAGRRAAGSARRLLPVCRGVLFCRRGAADARIDLRAVFEVGQYAGIDQALVERAVERIEALHDMPVEEHVENGLDLQREGAGRQRVAKCLGDGLWAEGIAVLAELLAVVEQGQPLVQGEQRLSAARLDPADHVGDLQGLLVILVLHQRQLFGIHLDGSRILQLAIEEVGEVAGDLLVIAAFDLRTLTANFTHAVEEQGLYLIVLGFFRALEQGVVDLAEYTVEMLRQSVHHQLAAGLHQIAEARLDAAAGEADHLGINGGLVLVAHGLSWLASSADASCTLPLSMKDIVAHAPSAKHCRKSSLQGLTGNFCYVKWRASEAVKQKPKRSRDGRPKFRDSS